MRKYLNGGGVSLKTFLSLCLVLVLVTAALAAPFIVADPQTATKYRMRLSADNGVTWGSWVEGNPVNGALRFDVSETPTGSYKGEAQAWGKVSITDSTSGQISTVFMWSPSAPFVLSVTPGMMIMNIRVVD